METIMKKFEKGSVALIVILIIILAGLVGGGAYYYVKYQQARSQAEITPSQTATEEADETASWQLYENNTYGYKIRYPHTWYIHQEGYNPPPPASIMIASVPEGQTSGNYASLMISSLPADGDTLETNAEIQSLESQGYTKTLMTLSGQPAVKLANPSSPEEGNSIYCIYNDTIYKLNWGATKKSLYLSLSDIYDKMIETFSFNGTTSTTSPTPTSETSEIVVGQIELGDNSSLQQSVDEGHQPWRLDPVEVARADGVQYGFSQSDNFELTSEEFIEAAGTYQAKVKAVHNGVVYTITLIQPETQGDAGIWVMTNIEA